MEKFTVADLVCSPTRQRCYGYMNWIERICAIGWDVDENDCWNWRGELNRGRARLVKGGGEHVSPYRTTYEAVYGPIPDGLVAAHGCHNAACINPDHIQPVTQRTNMNMRRIERTERMNRAEQERMRKLHATGLLSVPELSRAFSVTPNVVESVIGVAA